MNTDMLVAVLPIPVLLNREGNDVVRVFAHCATRA